jgi:hypothetical protein
MRPRASITIRRRTDTSSFAWSLRNECPASASLLARREPRAHGIDLVEGASLAGEGVAKHRAQTPELASPVEEVRRGREEAFARHPVRLLAEDVPVRRLDGRIHVANPRGRE